MANINVPANGQQQKVFQNVDNSIVPGVLLWDINETPLLSSTNPGFVTATLATGTASVGRVNPVSGASVALTAPPATLAVGDNALAVAAACSHYRVQNNSAVAITIKEDAAASAASFAVLPGLAYEGDHPITTALHVFNTGAGTLPLNTGTPTSGVVVELFA